MKIGSTRTLEGLKPVLKDPSSIGPDPAYWVFSEVGSKPWDNVTITAPGLFNGEYPKTFGHYHPVDAKDEIYKVISGEGIFLLQKKFIDKNGKWVEDKVSEVVLIRAKIGDEIVIKPEWGHSWSNIGNTPLITFDNWIWGHTPADYQVIEKLKGLAYYMVEDNNTPTPIPNPNYKSLPKPKWLTAQEFNRVNI